MRAICQRVNNASLFVDNELVSSINKGFLVYIGFCEDDNIETLQKPLKKICGLRVFDDSDDKLNLSLSDVNGQILLVSNFTLYGNCSKGFRPSFVRSAKYDCAKELYDYSVGFIDEQGITVKQCVFGGDMTIESVADGPINIIIDSEDM